MSERESAQSMCVDLLKLLRNPMTHGDIKAATGWHDNTVSKWLREFEAQGLVLVSKMHKREGYRGPHLNLYQLAPEWRGIKPSRAADFETQASL